jgi:hypothetical protein
MFKNGIQLIENDDMKTTLVSLFLVLLFRIGEELANVFFGSSHELAQNLGSVDDLWFSSIEHFADLSCDESFSRSGRTM